MTDREAAAVALAEAGVKAGFRGDNVRFSTHVYTNRSDLDRAVAAIEPILSQ